MTHREMHRTNHVTHMPGHDAGPPEQADFPVRHSAPKEGGQDTKVEVEGGAVGGQRLPQVHHHAQALAQRLEEQLRAATQTSYPQGSGNVHVRLTGRLHIEKHLEINALGFQEVRRIPRVVSSKDYKP